MLVHVLRLSTVVGFIFTVRESVIAASPWKRVLLSTSFFHATRRRLIDFRLTENSLVRTIYILSVRTYIHYNVLRWRASIWPLLSNFDFVPDCGRLNFSRVCHVSCSCFSQHDDSLQFVGFVNCMSKLMRIILGRLQLVDANHYTKDTSLLVSDAWIV